MYRIVICPALSGTDRQEDIKPAGKRYPAGCFSGILPSLRSAARRAAPHGGSVRSRNRRHGEKADRSEQPLHLANEVAQRNPAAEHTRRRFERKDMRTIEIRKTSITDLDTDAVVNAANEGLRAGGGVCGAIFRAAGYEPLQNACNAIGHCDTGSAVITPGFDLKAKFIIHAVGPRWIDGSRKEPEQLYGAYVKSLELAAANGCRSVGFPLISAGIFGYPMQAAWRQALGACTSFLDQHADVPLNIVFAVLSDEVMEAGRRVLLKSGASRYKIAERNDWKRLDMPEQHETFLFRRPFTVQQMAALRRGNIPQEMEDKWFWFMEGNTLFAHRSWTGICIYRIDFKPDGNHMVTVNRDPEQYACTGTAEDMQNLNNLLNWWTKDSYDYYHEWLAETADALKKAQKDPDKPQK